MCSSFRCQIGCWLSSNLVDQHDRAVHVLGDKADQQQQDVLLAAAESLVSVLVFTIGEVNVELAQFIPDGPDKPAGSANVGISFLN